MTPLEMHISFNFKYQKSNTNVKGKLLPEQIDMLLNLAQMRYIKSRFDLRANTKQLGFQDIQKSFDDIRSILRRVTLPAYLSSEEDAVYSVLPKDYMYLVEDNSIVYNVCSNFNTASANTTTTNIYTTVIPFPTDAALFAIFILENNGTVIYDVTDSGLTVPLSEVDERFVLINSILDTINKLDGYSIYWEHYGTRYEKDSFILITDEAAAIDLTLTAGTFIDYAGSTLAVETSYAIPSGYTKYIRGNRLTKTEDIYNALSHSFFTTKFDSPLSTLLNNHLYVYHNKKFIVTGMPIAYIRKPNTISVTLNSSCELAESTHEEIVDIAVQLASAINNSSTYANIIKENFLNE